jgi:anti-anti-sigma factor
MSGLQVKVEALEEADATVVVRLVGAADLGETVEFERHMTLLCARKPARVVFDLTELRVISSLCIGMLVIYRRACDGWNWQATLAGAGEGVEAALRRCRLDQLFTLAPSLESALAS